MHAFARHYVSRQHIDQRPQQACGLPDHIGERRARQVDVGPGVNLGLPVQR
jgi:hypothetical protein